MARRRIPFVERDLAAARKYLVNQGILESSSSSQKIGLVRRLHAIAMSFLVWRYRLNGLASHGLVFLDELASDTVQVLPSVLDGHYKASRLLVRGALENLLRHVYFLDHPVEFQWLELNTGWYMQTDELVKYLDRHPAIANTRPKFDFVAKCNSCYSELSAYVHARTVQHMEVRLSLDDIGYEHAKANNVARRMSEVSELVNLVMGMIHRQTFSGFQSEERQLIVSQLSPKARRLVAGVER